MTFSDRQIRRAMELCEDPGGLRIDPKPHDEAFQPASVDLRLGKEFAYFPDHTQMVDLADRKVDMERTTIPRHGGGYRLEPGGFVLGTTVETVHLGSGVVGRVEGKSSLGRLGITAHVTAGFIDPGFKGQITLEIFNASPNTVVLPPDIYICQLSFSACEPAMRPYGHPGLKSRYQDQKGVQSAK